MAKFSPDGTQLIWAGYLSGNGVTVDAPNWKALVVDATGDIYVGGFTDSPDFPGTDPSDYQGSWDGFVTRLKGDGSQLLWTRLLGGNSDDRVFGLALDPNEDVYVAGTTQSGDFPTTAGAFDGQLEVGQDAFVARLAGDSGAVHWASYLGGDGVERVVAVAAASDGAVVLGDTDSANFPAVNALDGALGGINDLFVTKMAADGASLVWSTYLGGSDKEQDLDPGPTGFWPVSWIKGDLALDGAGNVVVVGQTHSTDYPTTPGAFQITRRGNTDGIVTKIAADGTQYLFSTYLGGTGPGDSNGREEIAWGVTLNPWDEVLVTGWTQSTDFPTTADALKPAQPNTVRTDGFLSKLNASGSQLLYSTYLGGYENHDTTLSIAYASGSVVVAGWATAASFPTTAGAYQTGCVSCETPNLWASDVVILKFLDAFLAQDGFESGNYSGGLGNWAGNWSTSGDVSLLTSSGPHSGSRHVRLRSNSGYLERTVAVPAGTTTLRLGFWAKVSSFEGSDRADALARSTGPTFTVVASFSPVQSDNTYHYYEMDLTGFLPASQVRIAFDAAMNASNDQWYIDDIRLTGTSQPVPPIAEAGPPQEVTAGPSGSAIVTLDGAASFDPDGGSIENYTWSWGETVLGSGPDADAISTSLPVGFHTVALTVEDDEGQLGNDTVQVTVHPYVSSVEVFYDDFQRSNLSPWTQDGQNDWFSSTQRSYPGGSRSAEVDGSATDAQLISPVVDLQGRTAATITFSWYIESGLDSGEYLAADVSTNGGGNWTEVARLRGNVDAENTWHHATIEVSAGPAESVRLRFRGKMDKSDEDANVDNVLVIAH